MFRIKICGVTSLPDAHHVAESGADAIGLNFYSASPRCVDLAEAQRIASALRSSLRMVGVFVDHGRPDILRIAQEVGLDAIQLHGDQSPEFTRSMRPWNVIRAFRATSQDEESICQFVTDVGHPERLCGVLMDACVAGVPGGSGSLADWPLVRRMTTRLPDVKIILAGGLDAGNVATAIQQTGVLAVDAASGVESRPGVKDPQLMRQFVENAKKGFASVGTRRP